MEQVGSSSSAPSALARFFESGMTQVLQLT
jgi:hypothetical protein